MQSFYQRTLLGILDVASLAPLTGSAQIRARVAHAAPEANSPVHSKRFDGLGGPARGSRRCHRHRASFGEVNSPVPSSSISHTSVLADGTTGPSATTTAE